MGAWGTGPRPDNVSVGSFFRNPLGLFVAIVVVGLVLVLAAMSALGGTSSAGSFHAPRPVTHEPLTQAQFNRAGEGICLSLRSQLKWLAHNKPRNLRQVMTYIARGTTIFDRLTGQVDRIVPPASAAASFRRLQKNLGVADRVMHRLNHLTQTHQWRQVYLLVHSRGWKTVFKRFGKPGKLRDMHCLPTGHTTA
jgi:hypothetical protein